MSINSDNEVTKRNKGDEYGDGDVEEKFGDDFEDEEDLDKEENVLGKLILKTRSLLLEQLKRVSFLLFSFRCQLSRMKMIINYFSLF